MGALKHKALKGLSWSFIDNIAGAGITFLVGIILARILTPEEFGIIGIIMIFIAISTSIIDSGFANALIRKIDVSSVDYNTVFYFNLGMSIVLYVLLYLLAPFISTFFREPVLIPITRVIGLVLIINSFAIIQNTILVKKIDFKTKAQVSIIASVASGVIGIGMAVLGYGVWSLVGQQLSRQFFNSLFLWIFNQWRPSLEYSWDSFRELFSFGSKLLVSGLIDTIYRNAYQLVIGKFYSSTQLGHYTRALQFRAIFTSNLTSVIQRVSYPVLSEIQNEPDRLKNAYRKVIKMTMMVTFALILGLAAVAKPLIVNLIGEKWLQAVYYLQIISLAGMLYPLHAINLNMLQIKGRSDLFLRLEIIKKIIRIIPVVIGIFYGIEYMLWGGVFTGFIAFFLNSYYSGILINYSTYQQIKDVYPFFIVSMSISVLLLGIVYLFGYSLWVLILQILLGAVLTYFVYSILKNQEFLELKKIVLEYKKKIM